MIGKKQMFVIAAATLATIGGAIWAAQSQSGLKPGALFDPGNSSLVAQGKTIYDQTCAACHGANLEGQGNWRAPGPDGLLPAPPHNESGHTWHHTDELLFELTKFGLGKIIDDPNYETNMPVFDGVLSDEEITAVLSYIKSRWPKNIQARHDQMNEQNALSKQ